jgi:hypothetical protein
VVATETAGRRDVTAGVADRALNSEPAVGYEGSMPISEIRKRIEHGLLLRVVRTAAVRKDSTLGISKGFVVLASTRSGSQI